MPANPAHDDDLINDDIGADPGATPLEEAKPSSEPVVYEVVEHDGGWAYKVGDVFSETFRSHGDASAAAEQAAQRQQLADRPGIIEYEDADGRWHKEVTLGSDRPETEVVDESVSLSREVGADEPLPDGPDAPAR
ncbi:MAG TPA: DUF2188 domain-containing protein [Devosia sp.]|jgi:hypothetical protein|nr:DUF2188 domain-containing protein [Devosia sp.]